MIILHYPQETTQTEDWRDRLRGMALAHRMEKDDTLDQARLTHSARQYVGAQAITAYLDQLYAEREQWWYCTCDRQQE